MRILISSYFLDLSGTPTYTLALHDELIRRGHSVMVYSPQGGGLAKEMCTCSTLDDAPVPDIIIAQQNVCAVLMRERFPHIPMIFSAHGVLPEMEQPPECDVDWYTAINEDVVENLITHGVNDKRITLVRDFVDTTRFAPTAPIRGKLERVLFISNFKKGQTYGIISDACKKLCVELKAVGATYRRDYHVEEEINRSDLVISVARGIIEAMACGRTVVSFNQLRGDGYLTPEVYKESRTRNFAGSRCRHQFSADTLADELRKYSRSDGMVNLGLALAYHDCNKGVDKLLKIFEEMGDK